MPSSHLILCHPLLLLPSIPPSFWVFSSESTFRMRWPEYWSFSFSISPSNEHPGLISFRMDWLDLLAVQDTLKSLLQHHSSKVSIFQRSAFFTIQLSHPYMTTGKTIALARRTFVGKSKFNPWQIDSKPFRKRLTKYLRMPKICVSSTLIFIFKAFYLLTQWFIKQSVYFDHIRKGIEGCKRQENSQSLVFCLRTKIVMLAWGVGMGKIGERIKSCTHPCF